MKVEFLFFFFFLQKQPVFNIFSQYIHHGHVAGMQLCRGSGGPLAAANSFHLSANECLFAVFTQDATLLKQLIDH